jgi:hypothetical protein
MRPRWPDWSVLLAAIVPLIVAPPQAVAGPDCRKVPYTAAGCFFGAKCRPLRPAPCFWVVGRLTFGNGTPGVRFWPRGTHRLLGVLGGEGDAESPNLLPRNVELYSRPPSAGARLDLWGKFEVCPMATEKRGWMRPVCVAEAKNLVVSPTQTNLPGGRLPPHWHR